MKWYKHDSNANMDAKLRRVRNKYGMEGYGLYWYILELIAQNVDKHNLTFELEHDADLIAADANIHFERVQEMMQDFVEWRLFEQVGGVISCLKMASRTDEYTQKLMKSVGSVGTTSRQQPDRRPINSGDDPDNVRLNRIDRIDRTERIDPASTDHLTAHQWRLEAPLRQSLISTHGITHDVLDNAVLRFREHWQDQPAASPDSWRNRFIAAIQRNLPAIPKSQSTRKRTLNQDLNDKSWAP